MRKIANNTYIREENGQTIIRLHNTDIVRILPCKDVVLNTDNWYTRTTKERINAHIGHLGHIVQKNGEWYFVPKSDNTVLIPYFDHMRIDATIDTHVTNQPVGV